MATIIKSNSKQGSQVTLGLSGKDGDRIPMESPEQKVEIKPRPWPEASKKT